MTEKQLVLNGRWSGYFVISGTPQPVFHIKDVAQFAADAEARGVEVVVKAKTVANLLSGRTDPPPDGMASGFEVQLKTVSRTFESLSAAMAYRDRYGNPDTPIVEVAL